MSKRIFSSTSIEKLNLRLNVLIANPMILYKSRTYKNFPEMVTLLVNADSSEKSQFIKLRFHYALPFILIEFFRHNPPQSVAQ